MENSKPEVNKIKEFWKELCKPFISEDIKIRGKPVYIKKSGIYKITCVITNMSYIGSSKNIRVRWRYHINNCANCKLQLSIEEYGWNNHLFEIIEECKPIKNILKERERYWQEFYNVLYPKGLCRYLTSTKDKKGVVCDESKVLIGMESSKKVYTKEQKEKMKGKTGSLNGMSKKVINTVTLEIFPSITFAAESINMTSDHLRNCLKGLCKNITNFKYNEDYKKS